MSGSDDMGYQRSDDSGSGRPLAVWAISLSYFVVTAFALISLMLVGSGRVPLTPEQEEHIGDLAAVGYIGPVGIAVVNLLAAACLMALRKAAVLLFAVGLATSIGLSLMSASATSSGGLVSALGGGRTFVGWGVACAVLVYAQWLRRRGTLQ